MEINSIKDLIDALEGLGEPEEGHTRFFRGHSNAREYKLEPSIYREDNKYYYNEDNIIRDAIVNNPSEFSDKDTLFNTLVKLQHYGYPTRLLDLTTNALVSIYFSVRNNDKYDGEIIIFDIPNEDIKYFDSDTVSILSAISLRKSDFSIKIHETSLKAQILSAKADYLLAISPQSQLTERSLYIKNAVKAGQNIQSNNYFTSGDINEFEQNIENIISTINGRKSFQKIKLPKIEEQSTTELFNKSINISKLLHDIRKDKPEFRPIINKKDLERVICVKPKLNNERIIRQQGCFLLFGINEEKTSKAELNEKWIKKDQNNEKFIIPANSKKCILNELKIFGISQNSLFPELESQAKEILEKYKKIE
ncbi:FRG domain-containing protein [Haemophilus parainfluenzae]|jgi:raw score 3.48|uniref:FRG domain-containing protein n=1 Tax=Haemophilus parainfluenzae TaxID=729 RepID=UPI0018A58E00|nr:FRG domain-containing protein [Haemophilus parainfluenzae]QOR10588.1 FRG domain-containing protein [Haemophilus parainfluenzae]